MRFARSFLSAYPLFFLFSLFFFAPERQTETKHKSERKKHTIQYSLLSLQESLQERERERKKSFDAKKGNARENYLWTRKM